MVELETPLRDAARLRDRVHFVLMSGDQGYSPGTLLESALVLANPHLVEAEGDVEATLQAWAACGNSVGRVGMR